MDARPEQLKFRIFGGYEEGEWSLSDFVAMVQKAAAENGGGEVRLKYAECDWGEGYSLQIWSVRDETSEEVADRIAAEQAAQAERVRRHSAQEAAQLAVEWQTFLRLKAKFEDAP